MDPLERRRRQTQEDNWNKSISALGKNVKMFESVTIWKPLWTYYPQSELKLLKDIPKNYLHYSAHSLPNNIESFFQDCFFQRILLDERQIVILKFNKECSPRYHQENLPTWVCSCCCSLLSRLTRSSFGNRDSSVSTLNIKPRITLVVPSWRYFHSILIY